MQIADYKTFVLKKVQQDINNRRKRLGQNKVKILLNEVKNKFFLVKKGLSNHYLTYGRHNYCLFIFFAK